MASTWGNSWSTNWGNSWGSTSVVVTPVVSEDLSDGRRRRRRRDADEELTEEEVQFMRRKLQELKRAKTEREKERAAQELEISLAQAAQDDEAADTITATIQERRPDVILKSDYRAAMRDVSLLNEITKRLDQLVKEAAAWQREIEDDENDIEMLLLG